MASHVPTHVAVLGAGVAGLTAAHELVERGCRVTVVDALRQAGGKSRSIPVAGTEHLAHGALPGEHGFRFFPGFYRHLPDTMARVPCTLASGARGVVADNLVNTSRTLALSKHGRWVLPNELRSSSSDAAALLAFLYDSLFANAIGIPRADLLHYIRCVLTVLTSSEERRFSEFENMSAWSFFQAESRSAEYQRYLINTVTRSLVACRAQEMSARSNVVIGSQVLLDIYRNCSDRVLNGPSNEVWINPWVSYLESRGVTFLHGRPAVGVAFSGPSASALVLSGGARLEADQFILAVPVEGLIALTDESFLRRAPSLARLPELRTAWMNGILFYLDRDIEVNHGHTVFMDSPWALTSLFQQRFWARGVERYGDGRVRGILSACISDFDCPGETIQKPARACTPEEIQTEVWQQILAHLSGAERRELAETKVLACSIDPSLEWSRDGVTNSAPLFINTAGSWRARPEADVGIPNLFIAGDFVRTRTDVATMEAANESARLAVNHVLDALEHAGSRCVIMPIEEPESLAPLKTLDRVRHQAGLPHILDLAPDLTRETLSGLMRLPTAVASYAETAANIVETMGWTARLPELESRVMRMANLWVARRAPTMQPPGAPAGGFTPDSVTKFHSLIEETVGAVKDLALADDLLALRSCLGVALARTDHHFVDYGRSQPGGLVDSVLSDFLAQSGKRIRAAAALLSAALMRRAPGEEGLQIAIITESVHAATLLHDDIIDESVERRGYPSAWKKFGVGAGVLAGNLLVSRAVRALYQLGYPGLADALFDVIEQMIAAESEQLSARRSLELSEVDYLRIIDGKTAGLFAWCCRGGATVGGGSSSCVDAAERYGRHLGLAFQLVDDTLDAGPSARDTGKPRHLDLRAGVPTYPLLVAMKRDSAGFRELAAADFTDTTAVDSWLARTDAIPATLRMAGEQARSAVGALAPLRHGAAKLALEKLALSSIERAR